MRLKETQRDRSPGVGPGSALLARLSPPRPPIAARDSLLHGQDGATMVMGVFIATLLVGLIYYVWGIGDTILVRERMQDASDTAAFSAAVMHARGMNMIALLNVVMALFAFVAATMATIAAMLQGATLAASFVCAFCGPYCAPCCNACPYAITHGAEYASASNTSSNIDSIVEGIMTGLSGYAYGIRVGIPLAAQAKVVTFGTHIYAPQTELGVMAPPLRLNLPVQDDESNWPCDNKVLPGVRIFSPIFVWLFGTASPYMAAGILYGEARAQSITREWCDDGYFQQMHDDAREHGIDEFQVQAYMIGDPDLDWAAEGVEVAAWGEGEGEGGYYRNLAEASRLSFAQAEFFYDDDEDDWREWLWHQGWGARLRRWRVSATGVGSVAGVCGGACGALGGLGGSLDDMVVH